MSNNAKRGKGRTQPNGSVGLRLTVTPHSGKIVQELSAIGQSEREISRWVMDTSEKGIREALIALGWTPPNEELTLRNGAQRNGGSVQ